MYSSDISTFKPPVNTPKNPGDPVNCATNAQRNAGNAQQNQHFAVTVVAVHPIQSAKSCANLRKSTLFPFLAHTRVNGCNFGGGSV